SIFKENPVSGVGIVGYNVQIERKLGHFRDTHNVYLYILVTTGVVGGSAFLCFIINSLSYIYKCSKYRYEMLPLIIFLIVLFTWFKGGGTLAYKPIWLFISYTIGASMYEDRRERHNRQIEKK
ncbi:MAG: O-antigen ligase family protein, partial [Rikenellaceae bacterium]